jgi:hypothetical protein
VFEHLREITGARFRSLVLGTVNCVWLDDRHRSKAYERTGTRAHNGHAKWNMASVTGVTVAP